MSPAPLSSGLSQENIMSPTGLVSPSTMSPQGQSPGLGDGTHCAKKECCGTTQDIEMFRKGASHGARKGSRWLKK